MTTTQIKTGWERSVLVPAGQSALVGVAVFLALLVLLVGLALWMAWPWWIPPLVALPLGIVAGAAACIFLIADHRALVWAWELRTGQDVDGDGAIGPPGPVAKRETFPMPVPRPVPVRSGVGRVILEAERVAVAPSGGIVSGTDLCEFIRNMAHRGASFRGYWEETWDYTRWCDVVDLLALVGVVSERVQGKPTVALIKSKLKALQAIERLF